MLTRCALSVHGELDIDDVNRSLDTIVCPRWLFLPFHRVIADKFRETLLTGYNRISGFHEGPVRLTHGTNFFGSASVEETKLPPYSVSATLAWMRLVFHKIRPSLFLPYVQF